MVGEVIRYFPNRGFGFIQPVIGTDEETRKEHYFHATDVVNRIILREKDLVHFTLMPSTRRPGSTNAVNVRLVKRDDAPATDEAAQ